MKLIHIFWSMMILVIIIVLPKEFYRPNNEFHGGLEFFAWLVLIWATTSILSPILLILTKINLIKLQLDFTFALLTVFNLFFGIFGTYLILSGAADHPGTYTLPLFVSNLIFAILIILKTNAKSQEPQKN